MNFNIKNDFRKQISEDIEEYKINYPNIKNIIKDEWAFNFWVLDKIFQVDEELIEEKILDYHDMGIDCYEFNEDSKDLFLIQNKYYDDNTMLITDYVENDFLLRGINALKNGTYKRNAELQSIYNKYKNNSDFTVNMQLYVTNNSVSDVVYNAVSKFNNANHGSCKAEIINLSQLEEKYYGEIEYVKKDLTVELDSINNGTILNVNTKPYGIEALLDAKYVFTPVTTLYRIYRTSLEKNYPLFDKNIREYLGNKGVNKNIYKTLLDTEDRKNFFYYNNGITLICEGMGKINSCRGLNNNCVSFSIKNPQIVNGCQTVSTIYEVLKDIDPTELEKEYKDCYVMTKVLEIDPSDSSKELLYKNIVKYNNSQNAIDEKTFVANADIFIRLQVEFEKKGFLLLIKQSDENKFITKYKTPTKLLDKNIDLLNKYDINVSKTKDLTIKLEKFLQVILAFATGGQQAYQKKSSLLKFDSEQYNKVIEFIRRDEVTNNTLINLYLLYLKAEIVKKKSNDGRTPIPYYFIDFFAKFDCDDRNILKIMEHLENSKQIDDIIKRYSQITFMYANNYCKSNQVEYNIMIKKLVDYDLAKSFYDMFENIPV